MICIESDISRFGYLNEIDVCFGSFFAPIRKASYSGKRLFLGDHLSLGFYLRNIGMKSPMMNVHLSFEEQVNGIIPYFEKIVFPLLPKNDNLSDYLDKTEQLQKLNLAAFQGVPSGVDISEKALAYLSLNQVDDSIRVVSEYAEQCHFASNYIENNVDVFKYDIEQQIHYWKQKYQEALILKNAIKKGSEQTLDIEIRQREDESAATCSQFFQLRKKTCARE